MIDFSSFKEMSIGGINLRELSINGTRVWVYQKTPDRLLPEGYIQLEYIEATGTQYIDSGITGHTGISVETNYMVLGLIGSNTTNGVIIGSSNSANQRMYIAVNKSASPFAWELGAGTYKVNSYKSQFNYKYKINVEWSTSTSNLVIDDKQTGITNVATDFDNNTNMYILARNKGGAQYFCHGRLYDMKIWDNDILIRDYIPVKYKDGTVGLYDFVTKTFFTNSGEGTFIAGPVMEEEK